MKRVQTTFNDYEIAKDCLDCITCKNPCESGRNMMLENWTPQEVAKVCSLIGKSNKFLKELKSLEGGMSNE